MDMSVGDHHDDYGCSQWASPWAWRKKHLHGLMVSLGIHKDLFEAFEELNNTTGVAPILLGVLTDTRHQ